MKTEKKIDSIIAIVVFIIAVQLGITFFGSHIKEWDEGELLSTSNAQKVIKEKIRKQFGEAGILEQR